MFSERRSSFHLAPLEFNVPFDTTMGKKVSLLKALKNHQARFGVSERVQQAQREAAVKRKVSSSKQRGLHDENSTWKGKGKEEPKRYTIPFEEDDRILLIGEGQ